MAKTFSDLISNRKKAREEEEINKISSSDNGKTTIEGIIEKSSLKKSIGLDTFESDLADMGNKINSIYSEWQTPETMANTRVAVESMQKRVNDYATYQKKYMPDSTFDVDTLMSGYQTVLDDWDKLAETYSTFKDAESYKNYPNYQKSLEEEQKKKDERVKALDNSFDQYKYYEEMDDFEERSQYKSTIENKKFLWMDDRYIGDEVYEYINNADGKIRGELLEQHDKYQANAPIYTPSKYAEMGLDYLTEEEKRVFNAIYTDSKESAYKFLDDMKTTLLRRGEEQKNKAIKESVDDNFFGSAALSIASVPMSIGGGIYSGIESITGLITGEDNPYSVYHGVANESSSIRQNVGEEIEEHTEGVIGSDVFGQNIYRFLYDTGMSMADSAMGIAGFGKAFTPIMGMNAYQQKYKEMIEGGEDQETAQSMALASGVAETLFEHLSVEKLFNIKNVDGWKKVIKAAFAQAGFEGSEELFTELANVISDDVIRGEGSDFKSQYNELVARGYSEEEAKAEIRNQFISQLGWAFAGGALSGLGMGGLDAKYQYNILTETGKDIRANDRASEMINVASDANMTAQESETYKLYTEYANNAKGDINADNISDAQLGNLYATAKNEAYDTLNSKKTTPQQKFDAERRVSGLAEVETKKTEAEKSRPDRLKALETGEVTEVKATGNSTSIEGFRTENDETFVQTSEGEFKTSEMTFTTKDAELLSYAEGMGDVKGNLFLSQYDGTANIDDYAKSFNLIHSYGESGFGSDQALRTKGVLSERQAFEIYSNAMINKATRDQKALEGVFKNGNVKIDESVIDYTNSGKGEVNWNELTRSQRESVHVAKVYANALGVDLTFFNTKAENGVYKGKQGAYYGDGVLHVDIQAGRNTVLDHNSYIVPVMSHELTHHLERTSPKAYAKLQDHVLNTLVMHNGGTVHDLIEAERANLADKRGVDVSEISEKLAISELVARSCEDMLSNSKKAKEFLSEFTESERNTFVGKVKEMYHNLIKWIDNVLKKLDPKTKEAKVFREHKAEFEKLLELWDEALVEMKANQKMVAENTSEQTSGENTFTDNTAQLSMRTYENEGRDLLHKWLEKSDLDEKSKREIIEQMDHVYDVASKYAEDNSLVDFGSWSETDIIRGADGSPLLSVVVPNGDYPLNIDFSQVCKKRKTLNAVLNALVRSGDLDFRSLSQGDINSINRIIKEHGFEIACALCFVDSKRYRVNDWADSFTDTYNKLVKSLTKGTDFVVDEFNYTGRPVKGVEGKLLKDADDSELNFDYINEVLAKNSSGKAIYRYALAIKNNKDLRSILRSSEIISSAGLDAIKVENRTLYDLVNSHQGSAKPKLAHGEVPYAYDILLQKKFNAEDAYKVGGVRMQSFSDYMANMFFDYVQMIGDLAAKQLPAHAYTKEYYFAKLFGLTGIKINLSVVPKGADITEEQKARFNKMTKAAKDKDPEFKRLKSHAGLDENGNYILEDETFPLDKALEIQNTEGYDKNCGIIWVGVSNKHIEKMLDDPNVPYIIPYHKSSLNPLIARMRNIDFYNDYTKAQNTRYDTKAKKKVPASIWNFDFYGDLAKTNDPRTTADNYIRECRERGYLPKFDDFAKHPNYYKLLIDFRVYDNKGNYAPQGAVQMKFPDNFNEIVGESLREAQDTSARLDASMEGLLSEIRKELKIEQVQHSDRDAVTDEVAGAMNQYSDRVTEDDEYIANGKNYGNALDYLKDKLINGVEGKDFITVYRSFQVINGGLYAPMNAVDRDDDGKNHRLGFRSRIGVIEKATESPAIAQAYMDKHPDAPYAKFNLDGVDNATSGVAYNPYLHASNLVMNDQFSAAYRRNLVTVECRVPISEIGAYKAQYAKDPTGWVEWKPGGTSLNLAKAKPQYTRKLFVSRYMLPYRILDYSEVANMYKEYLDGTDIKVPWNVVGSDLREALLDVGIGIDYKDYVVKNKKHGDKVYTYNEHKDDSNLDLNTIEGFSKKVQYSDRYEDAFFDLFDSDGTFAESSAIIEEDVNRLKQRLSMGASSMSAENIKMIAKHLLQKADSRYDFEELTDDIKDIFEYIRTSKDLDSNALIAKCNDVASRILADQNEEKVSRDYAKMVLREIRSEKISTSKEQLEGIKDRYGDKYNNAIIGRIPRSNNGASLDSKWAEWSQKHPKIFDANIQSKDMLTELDDIVKAMQSASEAKHAFEERVDTIALGAEIYNQMWLRSTTDAKTDADKQKVKELNLAHRKAIDMTRNNLSNRQIDAMKMVQIIDNLKKKNKSDVKKAKELGQKRMDDYKDRVAKKAEIEKITKTALTLAKWIREGSKKNPMPDIMRKPVLKLLDAIDFSSKQLLRYGEPTGNDIKLDEAMRDVVDMAKDIQLGNATIGKADVDAMYINFPDGLVEEIKQLSTLVNNITASIGDSRYVLNHMTLEELESFDLMITTMKHIITEMNKTHTFHYERGVLGFASNMYGFVDNIKAKIMNNGLSDFLEYDNATPLSVFKRMGSYGVILFKSFQDAQDRFAFNVRDILEYKDKVYKDCGITEKDVREWRNHLRKINITDVKNTTDKDNPKFMTITMTDAQIMGLYLLNKREHARKHIYKGGIRIGDIKLDGKVNPIRSVKGFNITAGDVDNIISELDDKQIFVADQFSWFLNNTCSDWGNFVTMKLYGMKSFREEFYYPIQIDENGKQAKPNEDDTSIYRLLNMGFTKPIEPKANNKLAVYDIFDVFGKHTSDMAKYNAFALAITDFLKVYNYNSKIYTGRDGEHETESMQTALESAYGKGMKKYLRTFLEDINSSQSGGRGEEFSKKMMSNYKIAAVGANINVALLQPMSLARAIMILPSKYLFFRGNMLKWNKGSKKAMKHSGMAVWKSLGFYDTNITRGVQEQITGGQSLKSKIAEKSMFLAELGDKFTWGTLWNACELEVKDRRKDLDVTSDEFAKEVALKFREVVYSTQVVDSTLTRAQIMRSKSALMQTVTAFMSESLLTYNMVADTLFEWSMESRQVNKPSPGKHGRKFAKAVGVYCLTAALSAVVRSTTDIIRDDDEEEEDLDEFITNFKENFKSELNPLSKLPWAKDVVSVFQGYDPTRMDEQSLVAIKRAFDAWKKVIKDDKDVDYKTVYKTLQAISQSTGIPVSNLTRDVVSMWNFSVGNIYPSIKVKTK